MKNTHAEIARRAGVTRTHVTQIINGQRGAKERTAKRLAAASGWSWLFWAHPNDFDRDGNPLPTEPALQEPLSQEPLLTELLPKESPCLP